MINHNTLSSKKFTSFYTQQDSNVKDLPGLVSFLKRNEQDSLSNNNNENTSVQNEIVRNRESQPQQRQLQEIDVDLEQLLQEKNNNNNQNGIIIKLQIGSVTKQYQLSQLRQLSYFNVMFSQRWMENRNKNDTIKIFHDNNDDENTNNDNTNVIFGFGDLDRLLKCVRTREIPNDTKPERDILEGLLKCHDYCMNGNDTVLNENILIGYLKHCKPPMTWKQQSDMIEETQHPLLKSSLTKVQHQLHGKIENMRLKLADWYSNDDNYNESNVKIEFDAQTASVIFNAKLKFSCSPRTYVGSAKKSVEITILNFTNKDEYLALWQQMEYDFNDNLNNVKSIADCVITINDYYTRDIMPKFSYDEEFELFVKLVNDMANDLNDCDLHVLGINKLSLMKVDWLLHSRHEYYHMIEEYEQFDRIFEMLSQNHKQDFVTFILNDDMHCDCMAALEPSGNEADRDVVDEMKESEIAYFNFIKKCLSQCSDQYLICKFDDWFGMLHAYDSDNCNWILDDIASNMGTESAFDFGIHLTSYLNYEWDGEIDFPQRYIDFLKEHLGITWKLNCKQDELD